MTESIIAWALLMARRAMAQTASAAPHAPNGFAPWLDFVGRVGAPLAVLAILVYKLWPRFEKFLDSASIRAEKLEAQRDEQNQKFAEVLSKYSENSRQIADHMSASVKANTAMADQMAMMSKSMHDLTVEVRKDRRSPKGRGGAS